MKKILVYFAVAIALVLGLVFSVMRSTSNARETVYVLIPMTGSLAELGQKIKGAITLYVQENTPEFNVEFVDSASSPDKAIKAINQAVVNDTKPIVVSAFSFISNAIIPTIDEKGGFVFTIATASINNQISRIHHNFQRISTGIDDVITPLLGSVPSEVKSMSIAYSNDEYGMENRKSFKNGFANRGGRVINEVPFDLSSPMSRESIQKIINGNPDGVFVTGSASLSYINIFKEILSSGYKGKIFADAAFSNTVVLKSLGPSAENIIFVATEADLENSSSEKTRKFRQGCQRIGVDPYFMTAEAYDVIELISYLKAKDLPISQETLVAMKKFESVAEEIRFLEGGDCWYACCAVVMKDGRIVRVK